MDSLSILMRATTSEYTSDHFMYANLRKTSPQQQQQHEASAMRESAKYTIERHQLCSVHLHSINGYLHTMVDCNGIVNNTLRALA